MGNVVSITIIVEQVEQHPRPAILRANLEIALADLGAEEGDDNGVDETPEEKEEIEVYLIGNNYFTTAAHRKCASCGEGSKGKSLCLGFVVGVVVGSGALLGLALVLAPK